MQEAFRPFARENLGKTMFILSASSAVILLFGNGILSGLRIVFGACLIAFLIVPLAKIYEKKFRRPAACLLALLTAGLFLLGVIGILLPILIRQLSGMMDFLPEAFARLKSLTDSLSDRMQYGIGNLSLPKADLSALESSLSDMAKRTINYAGSIAGSVYRLILTVILSYFIMSDRDAALLRLELAIPSPWRKTALRMGGAWLREMRLYLRGQATIALFVGVLASSALFLIGIRAAIPLGMIVGLFNVIPYFGPFIGGIPAVLMALGISWQKAAFAVLSLFLVQQIDGLVLSPRIMGSITGFSPGIVLLSIFLGQQTAGIWGMLLAMPLLMSCRTIYRVFVQRHEKN